MVGTKLKKTIGQHGECCPDVAIRGGTRGCNGQGILEKKAERRPGHGDGLSVSESIDQARCRSDFKRVVHHCAQGVRKRLISVEEQEGGRLSTRGKSEGVAVKRKRRLKTNQRHPKSECDIGV